MTNIEHLIENGLYCIKDNNYDKWMKKMEQDINWQPHIKMSIDELWQICQYIHCSDNWHYESYFDN